MKTLKRIAVILSMALTAASPAFAAELDDKCSDASDAIIAGDLANAESMASAIYSQKQQCSAVNLADLAIVYYNLTEKSTDPVSRYDFALKTVDCQKAAAAKDAAAATARYAEKKVDINAIARQYSTNMGKFQKAISDSMNF